MKRDNLVPHPTPLSHPKVTFSAGPGFLGSLISASHSIFPENNFSVPCWGWGERVATWLHVGGEGGSEGPDHLMWDFRPLFPIFNPLCTPSLWYLLPLGDLGENGLISILLKPLLTFFFLQRQLRLQVCPLPFVSVCKLLNLKVHGKINES